MSHSSAALPLAMLLVFGGAKILGEIAESCRIPNIVGEILAGAILGPSILGLVQPQQVHELAELGVLFLLFRVGLEVKPSELFQVGRTASLVAILGVVIPFIAGYAIYLISGTNQAESLFVGAAMVATSVGITAQVLAGMGLLNSRAARIILAAAVIDDILGLIVLAVVSSVAKGSVNVIELASAAALSLAFTALILGLGAKTVKSILPKLEQRMKGIESQFSLALILLFALSLLASYAGVAAIIGAFLAGVALAETVNHRVHVLAQGVTEFLVPFFLAGIGLALNVNVLKDPRVLTVALIITAAAVATKFFGCALGAWSLGPADAKRIGAGMVPRGEVGMVVAQIGATLGTISESTYGVVVVMAVLTTVVAPILLNWTFGSIAAAPQESPISIE